MFVAARSIARRAASLRRIAADRIVRRAARMRCCCATRGLARRASTAASARRPWRCRCARCRRSTPVRPRRSCRARSRRGASPCPHAQCGRRSRRSPAPSTRAAARLAPRRACASDRRRRTTLQQPRSPARTDAPRSLAGPMSARRPTDTHVPARFRRPSRCATTCAAARSSDTGELQWRPAGEQLRSRASTASVGERALARVDQPRQASTRTASRRCASPTGGAARARRRRTSSAPTGELGTISYSGPPVDHALPPARRTA